MTAEKAYAAVMAYCADKCDIDCLECSDCIEMTVREALEKQIPRKPYNLNTLADLSIGTCPSCGDGVNSEYPFCGKCGQALKWE